jgi:hypothetical protein
LARKTTTTVALAFVGSAEIKPLTIRSLLNDRFGFGDQDDNGVFEPSSSHEIVAAFFPAGPAHWNENLQKVWDWTAQADIAYDLILDKNGKDDDLEHVVEDAEKVIEVTNVSKALVDNLSKVEADEKYVIVLWGDDDAEPDEEAEAVLTFAEVAGIKALDLTLGLEDLQFGDNDEEPEPEPAPEPEPEEKPRRRGRGRQQEEEETEPEDKPRRGRRGKPEPEPEEESLDEDEEALDDEPVAEEPVKEEPKTTRAVTDEKVQSWGEAGAGHVAKADIPPVVREALRTARAYFLLIDESNAMKNLSDEVKPSPITTLLSEALEAVNGLVVAADAPEASESVSEPEKAEEPRRRGRPRKQEEETFGYLLNEEEGTYRKAGRGRPRKGETRVELTQAQIDDLTKQELIDED